MEMLKGYLGTICGFIIGILFCIIPVVLGIVGLVIYKIINKNVGETIVILAMQQIDIVANYED